MEKKFVGDSFVLLAIMVSFLFSFLFLNGCASMRHITPATKADVAAMKAALTEATQERKALAAGTTAVMQEQDRSHIEIVGEIHTVGEQIDHTAKENLGEHEKTRANARADGTATRIVVREDGDKTRGTIVKDGKATREAIADVGRKVDKATADAAAAHVALDQKIDRRADEVVGAVEGVDVKVGAAKIAAETAASRAGLARDAAVDAKAEAIQAKVEAMAAGGKAEAAESAVRTESTNIQSAVRTEAGNVQSVVRTEAGNTQSAVQSDGTMTRQQVIKLLDDLLKKHP